MNYRNRLLDFAKSGEHDRGSAIATCRQFLQKCEAVHPRHHQIRQDGADWKRSQLIQSFSPVCRFYDLIAKRCDHRGQVGSLFRVIIDYEYLNRHFGILRWSPVL
jgi:hypothetical protein